METRRVEEPCLAIGVIADVQYADADDGYNFSKTNRRYYRTALKMLDKAVTFWNKEAQKKPQFVLQLGDVIDGLNKRQNTSESGLADVMNSLSNFEGCVYHIWGNHEYYNFSREYLLKSSLYSGNTAYSTPVPGKVYYTCEPHPNLRVIALDCYEISMLASPPDSEQFKMAGEYMANNLNTDKNSGEGLVGDRRRFVRFNGATSEAQIDWMRRNLQEAEKLRQNVIIMGHCGVYADATDVSCLCWNAPDILHEIHEHSDSVLCYLSGHDHSGGMAFDEKNILHMALPGVLENNRDSDFGTMYMYANRLELVGNGRVWNVTLALKYKLTKTDS
ncbi:manganese-dependent ADP-ribose/CDP-alcohol diphosphatase-like [Mercenaria mercenaria]|uniref:manganese-dependent ADP-ribose/CDP-alcohol diphosphatase-like n=1 Tax=Mercenaria mercenaria TaxID=6596 RepID=UPI00234E45B7|nr:manganese-dependent ADP-ribose/CDP-alcohol diphosphatase-like [Mercenaria mercenaria]XP_045212063.2 manganese-dependent ADP-ribose/CDP-alcohol diphosphatase-like [Mercenaria mercenaria]XP_053386803.1 manganese-dependent ADP-ribose/CDP-alcohol diphosphatase-like [Mercenaria mercenaria]